MPAFVDKSIRDLLVHIADTYRGWLGAFGLNQLRQPLEADNYTSFHEVQSLFDAQVDPLVAVFTHAFANTPDQPLTITLPGQGAPTMTLTPLQLFTHVITHEFHHKGQIMTMSRLLGHIPPDTDVIRF